MSVTKMERGEWGDRWIEVVQRYFLSVDFDIVRV